MQTQQSEHTPWSIFVVFKETSAQTLREQTSKGKADTNMKRHDFKRWRKEMDLSQKEAADALGLKRRVVQYYEKGERDGEPVKIPRVVRLACFAILSGAEDYHGPEKENKARKPKKTAKG